MPIQIPCASPLYIVREDCQRDLYAALAKLKAVGFDGIEFLGFFGHGPAEVRGWLDALDLRALGNHVPLHELETDPDAVFGQHREVGCSYLTVANIPMENILSDAPAVAERLAVLANNARAYGLTLLYHNHDEELLAKNDSGKAALALLMDATAPETLALEPDLGWMEIGGGDPAAYLRTYADRCPVLHLKDYFATDNRLLGRVREFVPARGTAERGCFEFRPTGYGVLNLPKLWPLCLACKPQWLVLDHDLAYERDAYDDLRLSLQFVQTLLAL